MLGLAIPPITSRQPRISFGLRSHHLHRHAIEHRIAGQRIELALVSQVIGTGARLRAGERGLMIEGLVVEVVGAGAGGDGARAPSLLIHFEDEVDGGATEQRDAADVQRVLPWHAYERGDLVDLRGGIEDWDGRLHSLWRDAQQGARLLRLDAAAG